MITDFFGAAKKKGGKGATGKRKLSGSNVPSRGSASKKLKAGSASSSSSSSSLAIGDEKENGESSAGAGASGAAAGGGLADKRLFTAQDLGDEGWVKALGREFDRGYFKAIEKDLLSDERKKIKVYPPRAQVFNAFRLCPFEGALWGGVGGATDRKR